MNKKKSSFSIRHALIYMLFFLTPFIAANFASDDTPNAADISRSLGVNIITKPGYYFISRTFPSALRIRSSDVVLELAGNTIQGGIDIGTNLQNITVQNGIIDGTNTLTNGISASAGCKQIVLKDLQIKNSTRGIIFTGVSNGLVANCELTLNTTGADLTDSHNIIFDNTIASRNRVTGFGMLRTTTCIFTDCKALSTGQGNTAIANNQVIGFLSTNGYGNIFERCIANSTQALSTTDYNSVIAGFALRGNEFCSKIIECESSNATTSPSGVTVPYGILLEAQFSILSAVTAVNPGGGALTDQVNAIAWSSDGYYLAVGGSINNDDLVYIYAFNWATQSLVQVDSIRPASYYSGSTITSLAWSPDGIYLAVNGLIGGLYGNDLYVYSFDRINQTLTQVASVNPDGGFGIDSGSVAWSPDGLYLAFGGQVYGVTNVDLFVYKFDPIGQTLTQIISISPGTGSDAIASVAWSPNGIYLAVGGAIAGSPGNDLLLYRFDVGTQTLTLVDSVNPDGGASDTVRSVAWSPDGKYLAVGGQIDGTTGNDLWIYQFNSITQKLSAVVSVNPGGGSTSDAVLTVAWSANGQYLAVGGSILGGGNECLFMYRFDPGAGTLTQLAAVNPDDGASNDTVSSIVWSPDGQYLAVGGEIFGTTGFDLFIYRALTFPSRNVINDNVVYCNSGGATPSGIGISGSSIANIIIQNTSYCNPVCQSPNHPIVESNYAFVCNVFNPLFQQAPTGLQNISVNGCEPIAMPQDLTLIIKQDNEIADSFLDLINDLILTNSRILATVCGPTPVSASPIASNGYYCLMQDISGGMAINASNVTLDLNGRKISGGITFANRDLITITNGVVVGTATTDGITATSCTNLTLENLTIKQARMGANLTNVMNGTIEGCSFVSNTTGLSLSRCVNVVIDNSAAINNTNAGFDLILSTTCCFTECKALSTGFGNTNVFNQTIIGFSASNGYGNIFERCIANGTQALSTIDSQSIVAGFMLTGTERCSKIIGCEAANAATSSNGVTVPYGILLQAQCGLVTVTAVNPDGGVVTDNVIAAAWSPDGQYLAVGGQLYYGVNDGDDLLIYSFDRVNQLLTQIVSVDPNGPSPTSQGVLSLAWSPDGLYLAVGGGIQGGGNEDLLVYSFDRAAQSLTQVVTVNPGGGSIDDSVFSIAWSPDGLYLAVGGTLTGSGGSGDEDLLVYRFDRVNQLLTQVAAVNPGGGGGDTVQSVAWSPDGLYLAVGGALNGSGNEDLLVYRFDRVNQSLTQVAAVNPGGGLDDTVRSVAWSPDGQYLAIGGTLTGLGIGSGDLVVYSFDRGSQSLTQIAFVNPGGGGTSDDVFSVAWSPDGQYLAIGGFIAGGANEDLFVYRFDRSSKLLIQVAAANPDGGSSTDSVHSVGWSPDGQYLAVGGHLYGGNGDALIIYQVLTFPSNNVIQGNTVYCNSGAQFPSGVGISGSSIANLIIQNTAYSNPVQQSLNHPIVESNYYFVCNVFNQLFQNAPTLLQNIALDNSPIVTPLNTALLIQQAIAKVEKITGCGATVLNSVDITLSGALYIISVTQSGNYCLAVDVPVDLYINGDCITIDLNGNCFQGSVQIQSGSNDVVLKNGTINHVASASIAPVIEIISASNVVIENVTAISSDAISSTTAVIGITCNGATNCQILGCTIKTGSVFASNADAGSGIVIRNNSSGILVRSCIIQTGDGGNSTGALSGGAGGHGILVDDGSGASQVEIVKCTIMSTGRGGNSVSGAGGAGGHGIRIGSTAVDIAVRECTIRNTGIGGTGTSQGLPGKAVLDLVTTTANFSQIIKNYACYIANQTKFDIQSPGAGPEDGIFSPNPPNATVLNPWANIFTIP